MNPLTSYDDDDGSSDVMHGVFQSVDIPYSLIPLDRPDILLWKGDLCGNDTKRNTVARPSPARQREMSDARHSFHDHDDHAVAA